MKKIIAMMIAMMTILVVGCSSGKEQTQGNINAESNGSGETVVYNSVLGNVEIPIEPQRVVADYYVGELLKLEAPLVGADLTYKSSAWVDKIGDIKDIGESIEAVYSLQPDLIITMREDKVEQYSKIAPTVCIPYGTYNPEELIVKLSEIVNRKGVGTDWLVKFNNDIHELNEMVDADETYSIVDTVGEDWYLYGENYGRAGYILYNKLGIKGTESAESDYIHKPDSYMLLTVEAMPKYIGDNLFIMNTDGTKDGSVATFERYSKNSIFAELSANKNENIYYFKSEDFWYTDPYSLDLQVEILKEFFGEKK